MPFAAIPEHLLAPLQGRDAGAWHHSRNGQWSPAQIVEHIAAALEASGQAFQSRADKPPMQRRPRQPGQVVAKWVVFELGKFPVRRRAPEKTIPGPQPPRDATEARLRGAVQLFLDLEQRLLPARDRDLFVKHPVFGDLTLREFMTFHVRHTEHHTRQMRDRLRT